MQIRLNHLNASAVRKKVREHKDRTGVRKSGTMIVNEELRMAFAEIPKVEVVVPK